MPESENRNLINFYIEDPARKEATKQHAISKDSTAEEIRDFILLFAREAMLMEREACRKMCEEVEELACASNESAAWLDLCARNIEGRKELRIGFFEF